MKNAFMKSVVVFVMIINLFLCPVFAQKWKEIFPLKTKCDDIKRIFSVNACDLPDMTIDAHEYKITIDFARPGDGWRVSRDTVVQIFVDFKTLLKLRDFETDFADYVIKHEDDAPDITVYENQKKGIHFSAQKFGQQELYIGDMVIYPSLEESEKFRCK